jgi:hypothetical protein
MRAVTRCRTFWTLRRNGETARAELFNVGRYGLELRYTRNRKPFVRRIFADGSELLREAAIERFELELTGGNARKNCQRAD